ncbi:hypothetical protein [Microcoleus sp. SVA1_A4]
MTRLDGVRFDRDRDRGYYLRLWDKSAHLKAPLQRTALSRSLR